MPTYEYTLNADECPAPQVLADDLSLYADPVVTDTFDAVADGAAAAQGLREKFNRNFARCELMARFGVGMVGIQTGLELDAAALVATVSAGKVNISGPVELETATTIALVDAADNYIWISKLGTLGKKTSADGSPLTPPDSDSDWCYLGMIRVESGAPTLFDLSGVVYLGGMPFRRTADVATPTDTPPSTVRLWTQGDARLWFWNGESYVEPLAETNTVKADGADTDPGTLEAKTLAGDGITLAVITDGGIKKLRITRDALAAADIPNLAGDAAGPIDGTVVGAILGFPVTAPTGPDIGKFLGFDGAGFVLGTPSSGEPELADEFTIEVSCPVGEVRKFLVDFSPRGAFPDALYLVPRCTVDQEGVSVAVLESDRTGTEFTFQVQVASDAAAGTYGTAEQVQLHFFLEGWGYVPEASPGSVTVTEDTYDYTAAAGGGGGAVAGRLQHLLTASNTATATLGGGHSVYEGSTSAGALVWTLPASPADGDQHTVIRAEVGGANSLTLQPNIGQTINGGSVASLVLTGTYENVTLIWDGSTWVKIAHCNAP